MLDIIVNPEHKQWDDFLSHAESPHIYQSWEWSELYSCKEGIKPIRLLITDGTLAVGSLLCFSWKKTFFRHTLLSGGGGSAGGPVYRIGLSEDKKKAIQRTLCEAVMGIYSEGGYCRALLYLWDRIDIWPNAKMTEKSTPVITLPSTEEQYLSGVISKNARNAIANGLRKGLTIRKCLREELTIYHQLQKDLTARKKLTKPTSLNDLVAMWDYLHPTGMMDIFLCEHDSVIVAGVVICYYKKSLYYISGVAGNFGAKINANNVLQHAIIRDAIVRGFTTYNLMGADADGGVAKFKMSLGAHPKTFYRFTFKNHPLKRGLLSFFKKNPPNVLYP